MDKVQEQLSKMDDKELFETFEVYQVFLDDQISFKGNVAGEDIQIFVDTSDINIAEHAKSHGIPLEDPEDIDDEEEAKVMHDSIREYYWYNNETLEWDLLWKQLPGIIKNGKYEILYGESESL